MDLNSPMLIEIGLNTAGYVIGGALMLVIYSMFRRRPASASDSTAIPRSTRGNSLPDTTPAPTRVRRAGREPQFVEFGGRANEAAEGTKSLNLRRNRAEVLRMARGMLQNGATTTEVKEALPVSDAELAMLSYEQE